MIDIDVRSNIGALVGRLGELRREKIPFATVYALTKTAQDIKDAQYDAMQRVFDRPTRFTLNSLRVESATKARPIASVLFKDGFGSIPAWRYLGPQIEGGPRKKKSFERALERAGILKSDEFAVPSKAVNLDAFGNMPGSMITRILSDLRANPDPQSNSTAKTRKSRWKRGSGQYFVLRGRRAPDGIYFRLGLRDIRPVLIFVRQPQYSKRLPFRQVTEHTFNDNFDAHFRVGMLRYGSKPVPRAA